MGIVRTGNVDDINSGIVDQPSPVGVVRLVTPFVGKLFYVLRIARSDGLKHRPIFKIKKLADGQISIRMRTSHKAIADEANVELLHSGSFRDSYSSHPCAS